MIIYPLVNLIIIAIYIVGVRVSDGIHAANIYETDIRSRSVRAVNNTCLRYQFTCKSGECIHSTNLCDGNEDCKDGSDETKELCTDISCPAYSFRCEYGACIDGQAKCNGEVDCADGSDENSQNCVSVTTSIRSLRSNCGSDEYLCNNGKCIDKFSVCDGADDCGDRSDETLQLCANVTCQTFSFRCDYGACIEGKQRCDGNVDCADGSDEKSFNCPAIRRPVETIPSKVATTTPRTEITTTTPRSRITTVIPGGCQLPTFTNGRRFTITCSSEDLNNPVCRSLPGQYVPLYTRISVSCDAGYLIDDEKYKWSICVNENWLPPLPTCLPVCKNINALNVELECRYQGEIINCNGIMKPGVRVYPACSNPYHYLAPPDYPYLTCQDNGEWSNQLFKCVPDCGIPYKPVHTLIVDGDNATYGDSPWHVAIYDVASSNLICGGTIISPYLIISAAHCFYDDRSQSKRSAGNFEIVVSKYSRNYNLRDNEFQKQYKLLEIYFPPKGYYGKSTNHALDIAILETTVRIIFSPVVLPACIEWVRKVTLSVGQKGKVVGWGVDNSGDNRGSPYLLAAELPYVPYDRCVAISPEDFRQFLTPDKFCAGNKTGPGVRKGDSGGGLLFRNGELYNLHGVVSVKSKYDTNIAAFTDIQEHLEWISEMKTRTDARILEEERTIPLKQG